MAKNEITFNVDALSNKDRDLYWGMSEKDKASFEKSWIAIEEQKLKLKQMQNKMQKKRNAQAQADRKKDAHRKIQCGGVLAEILGRELRDDDWKILRGYLLSQEKNGMKNRGQGFVSAFWEKYEYDYENKKHFEELDKDSFINPPQEPTTNY